MNYPRVGERVWVNDCPYGLVVVRINYTARLATLATASDDPALAFDNQELRENVPFGSMRMERTFATNHQVDREVVDNVLRSSRSRVGAGLLLVADLRASIAATMATIQRSATLLAASQELIERARTLERTVRRPAEAPPALLLTPGPTAQSRGED